MLFQTDGEKMRDGNPSRPLVILAFDSGDPVLLQRWAGAGYLPTVSSLLKRGCWAQTTGAELLLEHGAWLSIFSGVSRAEHGYYYFRQLVPGSYELRLTYGPEMDALPFWASLRNGVRPAVVDVQDMRIIDGLPGAQVANWAIHRGYISNAPVDQPRSEPRELLEEIGRKFGAARQIIEDPQADDRRNRQFHRDLLARVQKKGALCRDLINRVRPDVFIASFGESHTAGHQFWKYCAELSKVCPENRDEFAFAIRDVYQAIDREMGSLLAQLPESANVVLLSSIGMADYYPTGGLMEAFCLQLGYQVRPRREASSSQPRKFARRIIPERWRLALSRNLSRETRERLFADQFRSSADWSETTVFAIPSMYTGFLRVNLRGREPQGIVEPGAEYEAILRSLENDLRQLIDPRTGQFAIKSVTRSSQVYNCPYPDVLPDLIVHWSPSTHFIDSVVHPKAELRQPVPEFLRDSEHTVHGFFAAAGPDIRAGGRIADVEVLNLAPTFLKLIGQEKTEAMKGEAIHELFEPVASRS